MTSPMTPTELTGWTAQQRARHDSAFASVRAAASAQPQHELPDDLALETTPDLVGISPARAAPW